MLNNVFNRDNELHNHEWDYLGNASSTFFLMNYPSCKQTIYDINWDNELHNHTWGILSM